MGVQKNIDQSELIYLQHIDFGMWLLFILGVAALFAYSWKTSNETKGVRKYLNLSLPNILFHLVASIMVFLTLEETGEYLIKKFLPEFNPSQAYHYTLSALTGMFGSVFVAWILEIGKKLFGKRE